MTTNKVNPSIDSYFTNTLDGTRNDSILKAERDELTNHPVSVSNEAENIVSFLIESYKEKYKLTEKKKENNEFEWVKIINNFKNMAKEFVLNELIYN